MKRVEFLALCPRQTHCPAGWGFPPPERRSADRRQRAFSLLEVMIAMAIFFMAVFSILTMVSSTLRNARALQEVNVDAGPLAAELVLTNRLTEGSESGDFGNLYPGYTWTRDIYEERSNGLFRVDFTVTRRVGNRPVESRMSILLYSPDSPRGMGMRR